MPPEERRQNYLDLETKLLELTATVQQLADSQQKLTTDVSEVLEVWKAASGTYKFLRFIGKMAGWVSTVAVAGVAVYALLKGGLPALRDVVGK